MNKPEPYIAVFHHEYGVDCFPFYFVPQGELRHPSPRKVVEHFNINFEPEKGETFELVPANQPLMETLTAEQIGRETAAYGDWWDEDKEGWGDDEDEKADEPSNAVAGLRAADKATAATEIRLPCYGITIRLERDPTSGDPSCGTITSDLKAATDTAASPFNAAIDGLEALILAHASAGIDVASPAYVEGIETAVEAIGNHYGP